MFILITMTMIKINAIVVIYSNDQQNTFRTILLTVPSWTVTSLFIFTVIILVSMIALFFSGDANNFFVHIDFVLLLSLVTMKRENYKMTIQTMVSLCLLPSVKVMWMKMLALSRVSTNYHSIC